MARSVESTSTKPVDHETAGLSPYFVTYLAFVPTKETRPDGSLVRIEPATRRHMALHLWLKEQDGYTGA